MASEVMEVPPKKSSISIRIFHYKASILGYPHYLGNSWKLPYPYVVFMGVLKQQARIHGQLTNGSIMGIQAKVTRQESLGQGLIHHE